MLEFQQRGYAVALWRCGGGTVACVASTSLLYLGQCPPDLRSQNMLKKWGDTNQYDLPVYLSLSGLGWNKTLDVWRPCGCGMGTLLNLFMAMLNF